MPIFGLFIDYNEISKRIEVNLAQNIPRKSFQRKPLNYSKRPSETGLFSAGILCRAKFKPQKWQYF